MYTLTQKVTGFEPAGSIQDAYRSLKTEISSEEGALIVFFEIINVLTRSDLKFDGLKTYSGKMLLYGILLKHCIPNFKDYLKKCKRKPGKEVDYYMQVNVLLPASPEELNHRLKLMLQSITDISLMVIEGQKRTVCLNNSDISILPKYTARPVESLWDVDKKYKVERRSYFTPDGKETKEHLDKTYCETVYPSFMKKDFNFTIYVPRRGTVITKPVQKMLNAQSFAVLANYDRAARAITSASLKKLTSFLMSSSEEVSAVIVPDPRNNEEIEQHPHVFDKPFTEAFVNARYMIFSEFVKVMKDPAMEDLKDDLLKKTKEAVAHYNTAKKKNLIREEGKEKEKRKEERRDWLQKEKTMKKDKEHWDKFDWEFEVPKGPYDPLTKFAKFDFGESIPEKPSLSVELISKDPRHYEKLRFCALSAANNVSVVNEYDKEKKWPMAISLIIAMNSLAYNYASAKALNNFFHNNGSRIAFELSGTYLYDCETSQKIEEGTVYPGLMDEYQGTVSKLQVYIIFEHWE